MTKIVLADLVTYDASGRGLANRAGCLVVSVEYHHAPEAPFPPTHDDVLAATRWVLAHAGELGGDPARVAIGGESAGGRMAAATCLSLKAEGGPQPVFQLLVYPVASTARTTSSYEEARDAKPLGLHELVLRHLISDVAQLSDPRLDLLSVPLDQLAGLPTALVIIAERDPLRDEGEMYAERLNQAGVPVDACRYEGMMHEFFGTAAVLDQADAAQDQAADALRAAFEAPVGASAGS